MRTGQNAALPAVAVSLAIWGSRSSALLDRQVWFTQQGMGALGTITGSYRTTAP
jgi:hypothetical protein